MRLNSLSCRVVAVLLVLGSIQGVARADFPAGSLAATREGDQVRLEIGWSYHGYMQSFCDGVLDRRESGAPADSVRVVFDGDLEQNSMVCRCGKWYTWEEGMEDATGRACEPGDGIIDVMGSCPQGHACDCTQVCRPFYDFPCDGSYVYTFTSRSYDHPAGYDTASGAIDVTWAGECEEWDACGGTGFGCSSIDMKPHLAMMILFVLGAAVPLLLRRRGRRKTS